MSLRFSVALVFSAALTSLAAAPVAKADRSVAYCISPSSSMLRVFDLANPAQYRMTTITPGPFNTVGGMDFDDTGTLYIADWSTRMYRVNPVTGTSAMLEPFEPFGSFAKDLAWDPASSSMIALRFGQLQSVPGTTNQYYRINRATGQGTRLGILTGLPTPGGSGQAVLGLAIQPDGMCVLAHYGSNRLYTTPSTSTFVATPFAAATGYPSFFEGLGCDWARNGEIFTVDYQGQLRQVNSDGATRLVAQIGGSYVDIAIDPLCAADFNRDRAVDFFDYLDFVSAFAANSITADFDFSGTIDLFDYLDFVGHFAQGC